MGLKQRGCEAVGGWQLMAFSISAHKPSDSAPAVSFVLSFNPFLYNML